LRQAAPAVKPVARETQNGSSSPEIFKEVAKESGLAFQHFNGMTGKLYLPEIMGSGAALFDFDNDGDLDVFIVQGNVLEPGTKATETLFPWRGFGSPRGVSFGTTWWLDRTAAALLNSLT